MKRNMNEEQENSERLWMKRRAVEMINCSEWKQRRDGKEPELRVRKEEINRNENEENDKKKKKQ